MEQEDKEEEEEFLTEKDEEEFKKILKTMGYMDQYEKHSVYYNRLPQD